MTNNQPEQNNEHEMIDAFEVIEVNGFDAVYCETMDDAQLVADEWRRRGKVIGENVVVKIAQVKIRGFLEYEQNYIKQLREYKER